MDSRFDPKKDAANLAKHGISLSEGDGVLFGPLALTIEDDGRRRGKPMKPEYDFSRGKRGAVLPARGKTRITIYLDDAIVERFKAESQRTGKGYQTLINEALTQQTSATERPVTAAEVRRILRGELAAG